MPKLTVVPIILLFIAAGTAIGQDVRYNFDNRSDFSKFKTFKWVVIKDGYRAVDLPEQQIKDAVTAELKNKGLERSDSDNADLYIGYQAAVYFDVPFGSYRSDWRYGPGWYVGGWYRKYGEFRPVVKTTTNDTSTIRADHVAIDFYDSRAHDLIWRGMVKTTLDSTDKPDKQQKNLQTAIAKLLKNYPPETKNKK